MQQTASNQAVTSSFRAAAIFAEATIESNGKWTRNGLRVRSLLLLLYDDLQLGCLTCYLGNADPPGYRLDRSAARGLDGRRSILNPDDREADVADSDSLDIRMFASCNPSQPLCAGSH